MFGPAPTRIARPEGDMAMSIEEYCKRDSIKIIAASEDSKLGVSR